MPRLTGKKKKRGHYKTYLYHAGFEAEPEAAEVGEDEDQRSIKIPRQTRSNWRRCAIPKRNCAHSTDNEQHGNLNSDSAGTSSSCNCHLLQDDVFTHNDEQPNNYGTPPGHHDGTLSDQDNGMLSDQDNGTLSDQDNGTLSDQDNGTPSDQDVGTLSDQDVGTPSDQDDGTPSDHDGPLSDHYDGTPSDHDGPPSDHDDGTPSDQDVRTSDQDDGMPSDQDVTPSDHDDGMLSDQDDRTPTDQDDGMPSDQDGIPSDQDGTLSDQDDGIHSDQSDINMFDFQDQEDTGASDDEPNEEPCPDEEPFYQGSSVTLRAALLMVMAFILAHHLTSEAVEDLLKLMGLLLPVTSTLPRTSYFLKKYFKQNANESTFFVYCPQCQSFLGKDDIVTCQNCNKHFHKKKLIENGNYFITMSIEEQLKKILEDDDLKQHISLERNESAFVSDIYDGKMYKKQQPNSFSLNMNCDGLPIFKSAVSLWPIQLVLNELPPKHRKRNIILAGLWFGPTKPSMFTFLKPFTEEMQNLAEHGVQWNNGDRIITTKVFLSLCALDSVARCQIANMKQFNGEYGCGLCLNKGERVPKGNGYVRIYNHNNVNNQKRTDEQVRRNAADAFSQGEDVLGVKGPSPLFNVPNFDIVEGFPPDALHAVDLGVCRQVASLWLDSANHNEEWYIGGSVEEMDRRMASFHPPTEVTRTPHPVSDHVHWKGSEWRSWLLYYSLIVLKGILPLRFLTHWMLLVDSVYTLSKDKISQADFTRATVSLNKFVMMFPQLYGRVHMSFNVHQLLHLPQCARNWGPLWAFSSAWNEGYMASIKKLFHGTRAVPKQISTTFLSWQGVTSLYRRTHNLDGSVKEFLERNLIGNTHILKGCKVSDDVYMLGSHTFRSATLLESFAIAQAVGRSYEGKVKVYKKAIVNTICVHTTDYNRHTTRRNYCVQVTGNEVAFVHSFVVLEDGYDAFALVKYVEHEGPFVKNRDRESRADAGHIRIVRRVTNRLYAIPPSEITGKHVVYERNGAVITCHLPNLIERD